jgi:elongation factor 2
VFTVKALLTLDDTPLGFGTILDHDERSQSFLVDSTRSLDPKSEAVSYMREAFREILKRGPLNSEKVRRLSIVVESAAIKLESPETSWHDVTQPLIQAIRESFLSGNPVLLEPWIHLEISTPEEHVGALSSLLARRKGEVLEINSERSLYRIEAAIPVRESFGLANEIRTTTSGWATWGARTGAYRPVGKS